MFGLKTTELLILFAVILILFGGSRVAGLGKALGTGIRNFKKGVSGEDEEETASAGTPAESKPKA
ncbi:MAG TPA: twin-arginine translocase TatA/TatE family subunit [Vulgatibacter sp.]